MEYETAAQTAKRLGTTTRTVQLWAKGGKLPGAIKQGRDWLIPVGTGKPNKQTEVHHFSVHTPYPLLTHSFEAGKALESAQAHTDPLTKNFALAEYYYFSAQPLHALPLLKPCMESTSTLMRLSAYVMHTFASLSSGNAAIVPSNLTYIKTLTTQELSAPHTPQHKAICVLASTSLGILLHLHSDEDLLREHIRYLPHGLQLWGYYLLAHAAYLNGAHERAFGIAQTALALPIQEYPIPMLYLHLCAAMCLIALKKPEEAKAHMRSVADFALPDNFLAPIGEHHILLCGLTEVCFKKSHPEIFRRIVKITQRFAGTWLKTHNAQQSSLATNHLTSQEYSIAMLISRGWSNQEIADFMEMSLHTIKKYISIVYQKLGITSRSQLKQYMLV